MTCPKCGSSEVRVSRSEHMADGFEQILGRQAFRCRKCRQRFYAVSEETASVHAKSLRSPRARQRAKRRLIQRLIVTAVFGAAFLLFWLLLRYWTARVPETHVGKWRDVPTASVQEA